MYIAVSVACNDCGGDMAVKSYDHCPNADDQLELELSLGGMVCIKTKVFCQNESMDFVEVKD